MDQSVIGNKKSYIIKIFSAFNKVLFVLRFQLVFLAVDIYIYFIYVYSEDSVSVSKNKFDINNAKKEIHVYVV